MSTWNGKIHLAQFLVHGPTFHSIGHVAASEDGGGGLRLDAARALAAHRPGCASAACSTWPSSPTSTTSPTPTRARSSRRSPMPRRRPSTIRFRCSPTWRPATRHIGVASTFSTSQHHPFYAARMWATLDHLTAGRAGWNVVTSINHNQDANFGVERPPADERYDRAHEFMEVCRKLWASWDEDAVVMDPATPSVRRCGKSAPDRARWPLLPVARAAQRGPLAPWRAGHPAGGRVGQGAGLRREVCRCDLRHPAAGARMPRSTAIASMRTWTRSDGTGASARCCSACSRSSAQTRSAGAGDAGRAQRAGAARGGDGDPVGASRFRSVAVARSAPFWRSRSEPQLQRLSRATARATAGAMTMEEVAARHGQSVGLPQFVGTANSIADQMEAYIAYVGGDGFMISPDSLPRGDRGLRAAGRAGAAAARTGAAKLCRLDAAGPRAFHSGIAEGYGAG